MWLHESLSDLTLDLHEQYGGASPRPQGSWVWFRVVHERTSAKNAEAELRALLALHGLRPYRLEIKPGPEQPGRHNRVLAFAVPTSQVT